MLAVTSLVHIMLIQLQQCFLTFLAAKNPFLTYFWIIGIKKFNLVDIVSWFSGTVIQDTKIKSDYPLGKRDPLLRGAGNSLPNVSQGNIFASPVVIENPPIEGDKETRRNKSSS